jgi:hypothetical protein
MRAGLSFSRSPISLLLRQPLSIKKSYAGAIQPALNAPPYFVKRNIMCKPKVPWDLFGDKIKSLHVYTAYTEGAIGKAPISCWFRE